MKNSLKLKTKQELKINGTKKDRDICEEQNYKKIKLLKKTVHNLAGRQIYFLKNMKNRKITYSN